MVINDFDFVPCPAVHFGAGKSRGLGAIASAWGKRALLITGRRSLRAMALYASLIEALEDQGLELTIAQVSGEPSPDWVDRTVDDNRDKKIEVVLGVGGGSVLDAGKAVSAMLLQDRSVMDYLEGVGTGAVHDGRKVPFVAVPTTAGTGSEATKNAVLSRVGSGGFKKSLRHDRFVPDAAVIDPELMISCPPDVTAACGLDALTQLLESYVSRSASPLTDALAASGMARVGQSLVPACAEGARDVKVRADMAYGALLSGITLANAGLGIVHGLASALGAAFPIPHGVVCGTLLGVLTAATIDKLLKKHGPDHPAMKKYAQAGKPLSGSDEVDSIVSDCRRLVQQLETWIDDLNIPRLGAFGIESSDLDRLIAAGGNKKNPIDLEPEEIRDALLKRL